MMRLQVFLLLLGALVSFVSAGAPTFCKCTCFKNSTLIQLGPTKGTTPSLDSDTSSSSSSARGSTNSNDNDPQKSLLSRTIPSLFSSADTATQQQPQRQQKRAASSSCTQCTRAFCLSQNLPICKDADSETDVVTTCFQRDSRKDQLIVWGFILGTGGLLGWAATRKVVEIREKGRRGGGAMGAAGGSSLGGGGGGAAAAAGNDRGAYVQVPVRGGGMR